MTQLGVSVLTHVTLQYHGQVMTLNIPVVNYTNVPLPRGYFVAARFQSDVSAWAEHCHTYLVLIKLTQFSFLCQAPVSLGATYSMPPQTTFPQRHGNQQHGRTDALAILGWAAGQKLEERLGSMLQGRQLGTLKRRAPHILYVERLRVWRCRRL
ncbi:hypothetical protein PO909_010356 [Leuciscus waleckii]